MTEEITMMVDGEHLVLVADGVGVARVHVSRGVSLSHLMERLEDEARGLRDRAAAPGNG